jgi:hypothetical protein
VLQSQHIVAQHFHQRNSLFFARIANGIKQLHPIARRYGRADPLLSKNVIFYKYINEFYFIKP